MDYLQESAASIYRRRRHQRAIITLVFVALLLGGTVVYAASYVGGWLPKPAPKAVAASCSDSSNRPLRPRDVTVNVYNTTGQVGLAAAVAHLLELQGFKLAAVDNDPLGRSILTVGEIRHGPAGTAGAVLTATRLPGAKVVLDDRADASVDLVIGAGYRNLGGPPKAGVVKATQPKPKC